MAHFTSNLSSAEQVAASVGAALVVGSVLWFVLRGERLAPQEIERARRERLVRMGRITDGSLLDASGFEDVTLEEDAPLRLVFRYQVAGVVYEAAQDVSALQERVHATRFDLPVQVRYDYQNPANSIVVAEDWTGIRHVLPDGRPARAAITS